MCDQCHDKYNCPPTAGETEYKAVIKSLLLDLLVLMVHEHRSAVYDVIVEILEDDVGTAAEVGYLHGVLDQVRDSM